MQTHNTHRRTWLTMTFVVAILSGTMFLLGYNQHTLLQGDVTDGGEGIPEEASEWEYDEVSAEDIQDGILVVADSFSRLEFPVDMKPTATEVFLGWPDTSERFWMVCGEEQALDGALTNIANAEMPLFYLSEGERVARKKTEEVLLIDTSGGSDTDTAEDEDEEQAEPEAATDAGQADDEESGNGGSDRLTDTTVTTPDAEASEPKKIVNTLHEITANLDCFLSTEVNLYVAIDTDEDQLNDALEGKVDTEHDNPDTDDDGLIDGIEYRFDTALTNPDTDGDGLKDGLEDKNGNGSINRGETNPRDPDTDRDGLYDGKREVDDEIIGEDLNLNGKVDRTEETCETDPTTNDSDGDGVVDDWDETPCTLLSPASS